MKYFEFNDFDELVLPPGDYIQTLRETLSNFQRKLIIDGKPVYADEFFIEFGENVGHTIKVPENFRWLGWDLSHWPEIDVYAMCDGESTGIAVNPLNLVCIGY